MCRRDANINTKHETREGNRNKFSSFPNRSSLRYFGFISHLRQAKALHRIELHKISMNEYVCIYR